MKVLVMMRLHNNLDYYVFDHYSAATTHEKLQFIELFTRTQTHISNITSQTYVYTYVYVETTGVQAQIHRICQLKYTCSVV